MIFPIFVLLYFLHDTVQFLSFPQKSLEFWLVFHYNCFVFPAQTCIVALLPFDQKFEIVRISISLWNAQSRFFFHYFQDISDFTIFVFSWESHFNDFLYFRVLVKQLSGKVMDKGLILCKFLENLRKSDFFEPAFMNGGIGVK